MSRSRKKTPISGWGCSRSNKKFKQQEHRRERRAVEVSLLVGEEEMPHPKRYGNEWASPRDGKMWFGDYKHGRPIYWSFWSNQEAIDALRQTYIDDFKRWMRK